jgi:23S rRNA (uracil1939-C5)-methyltransferase
MSRSFLQQSKNSSSALDFETKCALLPFEKEPLRTGSFVKITQKHLSPKQWNYRYRISMRPNKKGILGYYQPQSHDHIEIPVCDLAHAKINEAIQKLPPLPIPVYQVDLKTNGKKIIGNIIDKKPLNANRRQKLLPWAQVLDGCAYNGKNIYKEASLSYRLGGIHHRISPNTFTQVNLEINDILIERITYFVDYFAPIRKIADLYSGCGNLSFPLLQKGYDVEMMEIAPSSVKDANKNLKNHNFAGQATIHQKNADLFQAGDLFFDLAILDPPRKGASKTLQQIIMTKPKGIIYVSCNPQALYREMSFMTDYTCIALEIFDMFPQTKHLEVLAVFERKSQS